MENINRLQKYASGRVSKVVSKVNTMNYTRRSMLLKYIKNKQKHFPRKYKTNATDFIYVG